MKQVLFFCLLIAALSKSVLAESEIISPKNIVGDSVSTTIPDVEKLWEEIIGIMGIDADLYLREADVLNLEATVSHRKKYIFYNPAYVNWINSITGDKWAALTLLAHEAGHHLKGHTTHRRNDRLAAELEADEFAGAVLYRLGATLEQTQEVMKYIAKIEDSPTHPGRASRLLALEKGWNKAFDENLAAVPSK